MLIFKYIFLESLICILWLILALFGSFSAVPLSKGRIPIPFYISHLQFTSNKQRHELKLYEHRRVKLKLKAGGQFRIKPKTNHSVAKRFKITATGKLMYKRATRHHLQRKKTSGSKARLRRPVCVKSVRLIRKIKSVLHNR